MWDRVKAGIRGALQYTRSRLQQIAVVAALFVVLGAGVFAVSPRDDEPSAVGLEMAGDPATFAQVLADVGPSISGGTAPPAAANVQRAADREKHGKRRPKLHRSELGGEGEELPTRSHDGGSQFVRRAQRVRRTPPTTMIAGGQSTWHGKRCAATCCSLPRT